MFNSCFPLPQAPPPPHLKIERQKVLARLGNEHFLERGARHAAVRVPLQAQKSTARQQPAHRRAAHHAVTRTAAAAAAAGTGSGV